MSEGTSLKLAEYPMADSPGVWFGPAGKVEPGKIAESGMNADEVLTFVSRNRDYWEHVWESNPEHRATWLARVQRERSRGRLPKYWSELRERLQNIPHPDDPRVSDFTLEQIRQIAEDHKEAVEYAAEDHEAWQALSAHRENCPDCPFEGAY